MFCDHNLHRKEMEWNGHTIKKLDFIMMFKMTDVQFD